MKGQIFTRFTILVFPLHLFCTIRVKIAFAYTLGRVYVSGFNKWLQKHIFVDELFPFLPWSLLISLPLVHAQLLWLSNYYGFLAVLVYNFLLLMQN